MWKNYKEHKNVENKEEDKDKENSNKTIKINVISKVDINNENLVETKEEFKNKETDLNVRYKNIRK